MSDAIGLVIELLREKFVEILKGIRFENLGMDLGDAIDRETRVNCHIGHMNLTIFDDLHRVAFVARDPLLIQKEVKTAIDLLDDHGG